MAIHRKKELDQEFVEKDLYIVDQRQTVGKVEKPKVDPLVDLSKLPNPRNHQLISFIKSGIRIAACFIGGIGYYTIGFFLLGVAEVVGIIEELV